MPSQIRSDLADIATAAGELPPATGLAPTPSKSTASSVEFYDYIGRGVPYGPDDGTVAPWAAITSLPFAPEIVLPVIEHYIYKLKLKEGHVYGFRATFNQTHPDKNHPCGWVSPWHYGLNEGPIILMIENYRTGLYMGIDAQLPLHQQRFAAGGI